MPSKKYLQLMQI